MEENEESVLPIKYRYFLFLEPQSAFRTESGIQSKTSVQVIIGTQVQFVADEFKKHGYEIPNIVFWNVHSRYYVFHADSNRKGVQLCSGQSASTFQNVISTIGLTPIEAMEMVINPERYDNISITSK